MERKTFSVVFFCKKTKVTRKGKAPIYARITTRGQSTEIYTQCQIEPDRWNQKAERSLCRDKVAMQINDIIMTCRVNILQAYDQLIKEGKPVVHACAEILEMQAQLLLLFLAAETLLNSTCC